jgi:hypothetical protein
MGIINFWKKKPEDLPMMEPPPGQELLTDLPSIDAASIEGSSMEKLPVGEETDSERGPKSMSVNMPTLDFSMPPSDEELEEELNELGGEDSEISEGADLGQLQAPQLAQSQGMNQGLSAKNVLLTAEELDKLFISDDWKEPDWTNYDPYHEEKIEEPLIEDFKGEDLPQFEDLNSGIPPIEEQIGMEKELAETEFIIDKTVDEQIAEPEEPFPEKPSLTPKPIELYIRGKAYGKVFIELGIMSKALSKMDSLTGTYEEMIKQEEPILINAKEQMEYVYRRLSLIDKKIFVQ